MTHKNQRPGLSASDTAIWLGLALMVVSIGALMIDSASGNQLSQSAGQVIQRVYPTLAPPSAQNNPELSSPTPFLPAAGLEAAAPESAGAPAQPDGAQPETAAADNTFLVPGTPAPSPVSLPQSLVPQRILIPAIGLDAAVVPAGYELIEINGQVYQQWDAPAEYAAGWQMTSAYLGVPGNTVLNGHHNVYGSVFGSLIYLEPGDTIELQSGEWTITYTVGLKLLLPERDEDLSVRLENGRWMQASEDERLTLVTCWPPESNTHRLFIVAQPVEKRLVMNGQTTVVH